LAPVRRVIVAMPLAVLLALPASGAHAALTVNDRISPEGLGPVKVGMSLSEAAAALGGPLSVNRQAGDGTCFTARPRGSGRGVSFLGTGNRLAHADVFGRSRIRMPEGAGIGTTERQVRSLYPGRVSSSRHVYVRGGRYLSVATADPGRLLIFETNARGRVTRIRAGAVPEVRYIEGCA
jgi:hypothetical protein